MPRDQDTKQGWQRYMLHLAQFSWLDNLSWIHPLGMLRRLGIALFCLGALPATLGQAEAPTITVEQGDALSSIAQRAGVSVAQLKEWNGLDGDFIRVGQKLVVTPKAPHANDDGIDWTPPFDYGPEPTKSRHPHSPQIAARDPSTAVSMREYDQPEHEKKRARTYRVQKGDTLSEIALKLDTTVAELLAANPGLKAERIYPGQTIDVGEPRPEVLFRLERGDTLLAVANRYGVSTRDLSRWNPHLRHPSATPGTDIRIYTRKPVSPSEAIGPTNRGRLEGGVELPRHRGYVIRNRAKAYGTEETTRWIVAAFDAVDAKFKQRKVVRVHDISARDGGTLRNHKSHQNGRDVDISYYQTECGSDGCPFETVRPSDFDVARQWALLEHWLRQGQVEMIFIDYRLQAKLHRYAKRKGVTNAELERWFQYPRGKYEPEGVIRHFRNHQDHFHVRFVCPYSDIKCRP